MKCIVVEHDPFWLTEINEALAMEGVEVLCANSRAIGLNLNDLHQEAALMVEIILPDKNGLEVMRDARAKRPDIPVIATTGGGRLDSDFYLKLADVFGANVVIKKPLSRQRLLATWHAATGGRRT